MLIPFLYSGYSLDALKNVVDTYRRLSGRRLIDGLNGSNNGTVAEWIAKSHVRAPTSRFRDMLDTTGKGST